MSPGGGFAPPVTSQPSIGEVARGEPHYPERLASRMGPGAPEALHLIGDPALLRCGPTACFASARLAPDLVIPALELARQWRNDGVAVISGFHSPVERECLEVLLDGPQPVLVCLARGMQGTRPRSRWRTEVERGRMLVLSPLGARITRASARSAETRNRVVAALAEGVFIAGATPGGRLHVLARDVVARGQPLACFDHRRNHDLLLLGASPVRTG